MATICIDTSAVIAVILGEKSRARILDRTQGSEILVSETMRLEIPNAFTNKFKRRLMTLDEAHDALDYFARIAAQEISVDPHQVIELAHTLDIYAYDAYPIAVALNQRSPFLSLDGGQNDAARRAGVEVVDIS
jgi:predicted nucleic acid-binding protein